MVRVTHCPLFCQMRLAEWNTGHPGVGPNICFHYNFSSEVESRVVDAAACDRTSKYLILLRGSGLVYPSLSSFSHDYICMYEHKPSTKA